MSLSNGIPETREGWPPAVLDACAAFSCGDVVENPPYFYFADPRYAVMARTKEYFDDQFVGPEIIDAADWAAPFGVITSQTCDVGEIDFPKPAFPFVSIAPVFDVSKVLDPSIQSLLRRGKRVGPYLHLPLLADRHAGFWVADFRIELPVEKSWLVGREPIKGFATEEAARAVPAVLNDLRSRPAWALVVNDCVEGGLRTHLDALKIDARDLYKKVVFEIDRIGVRADSMMKPTLVTLAAFTELPDLSAEVRAWWDAITPEVEVALRAKGILATPAEVHSLTTCTVAQYEKYAPVSLGGKYSPG